MEQAILFFITLLWQMALGFTLTAVSFCVAIAIVIYFTGEKTLNKRKRDKK